MPHTRDVVRIAAVGDLHYNRSAAQGGLHPLFSQINEAADILVLCGDLTDYGLLEEGRALVREMASLKIPTVAVLGNHDFESGLQAQLRQIFLDAGVITLDGDSTEILGIGFAGVKGFAGGFGRRALGPWGEESHQEVRARGRGRGPEAGIGACAAAQQTPDRGAPLRPHPGHCRR